LLLPQLTFAARGSDDDKKGINFSKIFTLHPFGYLLFIALSLSAVACSGSQKVLKSSMDRSDVIAVVYRGDMNDTGIQKELYLQRIFAKYELPYERAPKLPYPKEYATIISEVVKHLQSKYPDKKIELVNPSQLPVKDGKIAWTETKYNMYFVLRLNVHYTTSQFIGGPNPRLHFIELRSGLDLEAFGKDEQGIYKNIPLSGVLPMYTLSSVWIEDPNKKDAKRQFDIEEDLGTFEKQKAMLESLVKDEPLMPEKIVQPTIQEAKKNIDKLVENLNKTKN